MEITAERCPLSAQFKRDMLRSARCRPPSTDGMHPGKPQESPDAREIPLHAMPCPFMGAIFRVSLLPWLCMSTSNVTTCEALRKHHGLILTVKICDSAERKRIIRQLGLASPACSPSPAYRWFSLAGVISGRLPQETLMAPCHSQLEYSHSSPFPHHFRVHFRIPTKPTVAVV